jgi:hypothetical protein
MYGYSVSQTGNAGNADEIVVFFFFVHVSQLYHKFQREKQVAMKTTSYEKLRITVNLRITANCNRLPPYVILNGKTVPKETFCGYIILRPKKNAWMTSS